MARPLDAVRLPRLVATDLDGTSGPHGTARVGVHPQVLGALEDPGVPLVLVTGRPLRWTEEVFEHVGAYGLAVVSNGASSGTSTSTAWRERPSSVEAGLAVVAAIRGRSPRVFVRASRPLDGTA